MIGITYDEQYFFDHPEAWSILAPTLNSSEWCLSSAMLMDQDCQGLHLALTLAIACKHRLYFHFPHHIGVEEMGLDAGRAGVDGESSFLVYSRYVNRVLDLLQALEYRESPVFVMHPYIDLEATLNRHQILTHVFANSGVRFLVEVVPLGNWSPEDFAVIGRDKGIPLCLDVAHLDTLSGGRVPIKVTLNALLESTEYAHIHSWKKPHGFFSSLSDQSIYCLQELALREKPLSLELLNRSCSDYGYALQRALDYCKSLGLW